MNMRTNNGRACSGWIAIAFLIGCLASTPAISDAPEIMVYKTPTCGCCGKWVKHLEEAGFSVQTRNMDDLSGLKEMHHLTPNISSCHTAIVDGYVVEGHVPAEVIFRLLKERPDVAGIAVPGMPAGSPGMEIPSGYVQPYEVLAFDEDGSTAVFARIGTDSDSDDSDSD